MMTTRLLRLVPVVALLLLAALSSARDDAPKAPPRTPRLSEAEIERYVGLLGSPDFRAREGASEMLKWRPEAAVALRRANRTTTDPEVKRRLELLLPVRMSEERAKELLARLPEYVKYRQIDRFVETMVACREFLTEEHDESVRALVNALYHPAYTHKDRPDLSWPRSNPWDLVWYPSVAWKKRDKNIVIDTQILTDSNRANLAILSGNVKSNIGLFQAVVFSNGDIDVRDLTNSIVITSGSIHLSQGNVDASVIISLGEVDIGGGGEEVVIVSGGRISYSGNSTWGGDTKSSLIRQNDLDFFRDWRLYRASDVGAKLWSLYGIVGVATVTAGSPLSRADIRPGDIIVQVDGEPVRSIVDVSRLLCRASLLYQKSEITITRNSSIHYIILS